ncbi:MAG: hypothetical protein AAB436_04200 [Patescibacteria group bacterium]
MNKHNQDGAINGVVVSLVLTVLLLFGAIGFGAWAYTSQQDYKNNSDEKAAVAAEAAKKEESIKKDKQFAEEIKNPLKTYVGPEAYGSLVVSFPKTWSGYVDDTGRSSGLVDGYFAQGTVPSKDDINSVFALRFRVNSQPYASFIKNYSALQKSGKITVSAYALPKLPKTVGIKLTGTLNDKTNVTMVVLPLRSQTLQVWTEGSQYVNDFNNSILPNFTFSP